MRGVAIVAGLWGLLGISCTGKAHDNGSVSAASPGQACDEPGQTASCYTGPTGTVNVGACKGGVTTCTWNLTWSDCTGEQLPAYDDCFNATDDDCDGKVDEGDDLDGDGWGVCAGDCCDTTDCAVDPKKVNPGAFEAPGNNLDDDCDGVIDNPDPGCVAGDPSDPLAFARALDVCRSTTENATGVDQRWGVISVTLSRADGNALPDLTQAAIRDHFGVNTPRYGDSMVLLSTGPALDSADAGWKPWQPGTAVQGGGPNGSVPASWLAANAGAFPSAPGCPAPGGTDVFDPVMLTLKLRVPTNASSFTISSFFMSAEYPEYVCSSFNDFFIMLLSSGWQGDPANPKDGNLAFYTSPDGKHYPIGVNLAQGTGLFQQCENGTLGCSGMMTSTTTSCVSTTDLTGTGFDSPLPTCDAVDGPLGGGTGWLTTTGNVVPGEIITLKIAIWDTSDPIYDSAAIIDNFHWNIDPTTPGTGTGIP